VCSPRLGVDSWEVRMNRDKLLSIIARTAIVVICLCTVTPVVLFIMLGNLINGSLMIMELLWGHGG
jgi:hypothetical protein